MEAILTNLFEITIGTVLALVLLGITAPLWAPIALGAVEVFGKFCDIYARYEDWRDARRPGS